MHKVEDSRCLGGNHWVISLGGQTRSAVTGGTRVRCHWQPPGAPRGEEAAGLSALLEGAWWR